MVKVVNGGFVLSGVTNRNGNDDAILVKTDNSGNTIWTTVLGDANVQWFEGHVQTADGGYAAVGVNTGTGTNGWYDIYLVKFNALGVKQWEKSIGGQDFEIGNSIQQTADGGFILSGSRMGSRKNKNRVRHDLMPQQAGSGRGQSRIKFVD